MSFLSLPFGLPVTGFNFVLDRVVLFFRQNSLQFFRSFIFHIFSFLLFCFGMTKSNNGHNYLHGQCTLPVIGCEMHVGERMGQTPAGFCNVSSQTRNLKKYKIKQKKSQKNHKYDIYFASIL